MKKFSAGFKFIDLFAGCGGLSLGLESAGFVPILFSEIDEMAAETYLHNRRHLEIEVYRDVHDIEPADLNKVMGQWRRNGVRRIDLVCGGPPCQPYSSIGHRRTERLPRATIQGDLFREMVRIIKVVRPRLFLFENVRGLLSAKWNQNGQSGEIFHDVLTSFWNLSDYIVRWELLEAKNYGVPQIRPRVFIVGINKKEAFGSNINERGFEDVLFNRYAIADRLLPAATNERPPNLEDLLDDLVDENYGVVPNTTTYPREANTAMQKELRSKNGYVSRKGEPVTDHIYTKHSKRTSTKFQYMIEHDGKTPPKHKTKKFMQRVLPSSWGENGPNVTITSLPDDFVHYSQPRILTVREWARMQTFPDWYEFKGKRTTGGTKRAGRPSEGNHSREVPKYTQIGNAVAVKLASHIGQHFAQVILKN